MIETIIAVVIKSHNNVFSNKFFLISLPTIAI